MSSRGTQFGRTMEYFRTADIEEADAALTAAIRIVQQRQADARPARIKAPRTRRPVTVAKAVAPSQLTTADEVPF